MIGVMKIFAAVAFSFILLSTSAHAEFISFTFEGTADFSIDGTTNTNVDFQFLGSGDTDNIASNVFDPNLMYLNHDSATIDLGALGLFSVSSGTSTFVNQTSGVFGIGDAGAGITEFDTVSDTFFNTYDLTSSFGPVDLAVDNNSASFDGSDGNGNSTITFTSFLAPVSLSAVVASVPEPTAVCLLALGFGACGLRRRRIS